MIYSVIAVLALVTLTCVGGLAWAVVSLSRNAQARSVADSTLIRRMTDTLSLMVKDESQVRRLEIGAIEPAAQAYKKAIDRHANSAGIGWTPPVEEPDEEVAIRG